MRVVHAIPPMFAEIDAKFKIKGKPALFAWGDRIFNPLGAPVPPELLAHEGVHGKLQGEDVEGWWRQYIADQDFRLQQEIPAHAAEFECLCRLNAHKWRSMRSMRRTIAAHVARKLSAELYGPMISFHDAKKLLMQDGAA